MSNPTGPPQHSTPTTSNILLDAVATLIQTLQNANQQPQQQQQQLQQPQVQAHQHRQSTSYQDLLQARQQELLQPQSAQTQQPQPRQFLIEGPGTQYRRQRRGNTGSFGHPNRVQLFNQPLQTLNTQYASTQTSTFPSTATSGISTPATSAPATSTPTASNSTQSLQTSVPKIKLIWEAWILPYNQSAFDSPQQCAKFVSTHKDRAVADFESFFNCHDLFELERQDGFVEAKAMYFPNSELQYTLYDELPSQDSPGTTIPWNTISERTLSEIALEHGQAIYEQQPAKRGRPRTTQVPKLKGYKFKIGIRPQHVHTTVPTTTNYSVVTPIATRSSSVEYVGAREREEVHDDDNDYQTIWNDSDMESLPSMRSLLHRSPNRRSHKLPIRSSPAGSNQQTPCQVQQVRETEQQPNATDPAPHIAPQSAPESAPESVLESVPESAPESAPTSALESALVPAQTDPEPTAPGSSATSASRKRAISRITIHPATKRSRYSAPSSFPTSASAEASSSAPKGDTKSKKPAPLGREYNLRLRPDENGAST